MDFLTQVTQDLVKVRSSLSQPEISPEECKEQLNLLTKIEEKIKIETITIQQKIVSLKEQAKQVEDEIIASEGKLPTLEEVKNLQKEAVEHLQKVISTTEEYLKSLTTETTVS